MPKVRILDSTDKNKFESPPDFNNFDRKIFLTFPENIIQQFEKMIVPSKKSFFLLIFGYFKATNKFYPNKYHEKDLKYVCKKHFLPYEKIDILSYDRQTFHNHKKIVLDYFGFRNFDKSIEHLIKSEINPLIRSHVKSREIFHFIVEFLIKSKIEVPSYNQIASIIIEARTTHKTELIKTINKKLTEEKKRLLDSLLEKVIDEKSGKEINRYKLTWLKKFSQSTRPGKIKINNPIASYSPSAVLTFGKDGV